MPVAARRSTGDRHVREPPGNAEDSHGSSPLRGEQQMVAIGRALIADPDLLLLDEPTEGLAPYIVRQIERIIEDLNDQGITVLVVETASPSRLVSLITRTSSNMGTSSTKESCGRA